MAAQRSYSGFRSFMSRLMPKLETRSWTPFGGRSTPTFVWNLIHFVWSDPFRVLVPERLLSRIFQIGATHAYRGCIARCDLLGNIIIIPRSYKMTPILSDGIFRLVCKPGIGEISLAPPFILSSSPNGSSQTEI